MEKYCFIGDIHGCIDEFKELLTQIPEDRTLVVLGDWADRGPSSLSVLKILVEEVKHSKMKVLRGNHCNKLYRWAIGNQVSLGGGIKTTVAEINKLSLEEQAQVKKDIIFIYNTGAPYMLFDNKKVVASHAGWDDSILNNTKITKNDIDKICLYGNITGQKGADGFPTEWADQYKGNKTVIYGHIVHDTETPYNVGNVYCLDTGCVHGGNLTGMLYPEMTYIQVKAKKKYH
jgi:protein phosphatase